MSKVDRVLRRLYPGRSEFTLAEREFAARALAIAREEGSGGRMSSEFIPVGGRFVRRNIEFECIVRPDGLELHKGCSGCGFNDARACDAPPCSKFDRTDGEFVWFRRVEG